MFIECMTGGLLFGCVFLRVHVLLVPVVGVAVVLQLLIRRHGEGVARQLHERNVVLGIAIAVDVLARVAALGDIPDLHTYDS